MLAQQGVLGRFALDFVGAGPTAGGRPTRSRSTCDKGGTTHPFLTLQFLTDGQYDADSSRFLTPTGDERHLVATDHFADESLKGLRLADLFDLVAVSGMHFDQARERGVVFHMMSGITELGGVGMTAVGSIGRRGRGGVRRRGGRLRDEARVALEPQSLGDPLG